MRIRYFFPILLITALSASGQQPSAPKGTLPGAHREIQEDPYLPNEFGNRKTSPARKYKATGIYTTQVNVDANGNNILGDAANEPSITVDPTNPNVITIGWRQFDNVWSNFRQAGYGYSSDAGQTWTFPGVIQPGVFRSDPVLGSDNTGALFYNSLTSSSGSYFCHVFKSGDGGASWDNGVSAQGGDKQWMLIDKTGGPGEGNNYSFWTSWYSICSPDHFTRSVDGGASFEFCVSIPGNPYWGTLAAGKEGELYAGGSGGWGGPIVAKSSTAWDPGLPVQWDFWVPVNLDGYLSSGLGLNPVGLIGQMSIDVDNSTGPGEGNVYSLCSVIRFSNGDSADVMFARSTDGGLTWSDPVRVNDDPGTSAYQWFGVMSVAPNGRIDAVWLDTRDDVPYGYLSSLYYSYSIDQGTTWAPNIRLSESFDPHLGWPNQQKMGDYFDTESDNDGVHLAWANTFNGEQDVYYSYITVDITGTGSAMDATGLKVSLSPNPAGMHTALTATLPFAGKLDIRLLNTLGNEVKEVPGTLRQAGLHTIPIDLNGVSKGIYILEVRLGELVRTLKLVIN